MLNPLPDTRKRPPAPPHLLVSWSRPIKRTCRSTPARVRTTAKAREAATKSMRARMPARGRAPALLTDLSRPRSNLNSCRRSNSGRISDTHPLAGFRIGVHMPANRFNGYTDYGVGIGLRVPHYEHILSRKPVVDWFEIISENYMVDGGRPLEVLDQILEQ